MDTQRLRQRLKAKSVTRSATDRVTAKRQAARVPTTWRRALITGASSGIGRAFALDLAEQGTALVLVARDKERLEALAAEVPVDAEVLVADLSDREQVRSVADRLADEDAPVDLLINNAGFGQVGDFIDLDPDAEASVIEVNVTAMHRLAHAAGAAMAARGEGWILNVSSMAGFNPSPRGATYAATKAFVTSFSEALHVELGPQGVVVSCLCPGLTRTEFHERAQTEVGMPAVFWQSAEAVAVAGLHGLAAGKALVVPGGQNKAIRAASKVVPGRAARKVSAQVSKRTKR